MNETLLLAKPARAPLGGGERRSTHDSLPSGMAAALPCVLFRLSWSSRERLMRFSFVSDSAREMLGIPAALLLEDVEELYERMKPGEAAQLRTALEDLFATRASLRETFRLHIGAETRSFELHARLVDHQRSPYIDGCIVRAVDPAASRNGAVVSAQDHVDELTGLPNRAQLLQHLERMVEESREQARGLGVLFLNLDRFMNVNNSLGEQSGDALLRTTACRLRNAVRHSDHVGRVGGDEFVVLLDDLRSADAAVDVARKLLEVVSRPFHVVGQQVSISASIGIAVYPDDGVTAGDLLRNAGAAMRHAKVAGRNAFEFYARRMNDRAMGTLGTLSALRLALERGELLLHYQPQVDTVTGAVIGAEALVRWNRPDVGLVMPGDFIPVAEDGGLIGAIDRWVVDEALRQIRVWDAAGQRVPVVAVNLSALEFHRDGCVAELERALQRAGVAPGRLELELTESMAVQDVKSAADILSRMHAIGVQLSLDDFGTGYSCLNYLRRFPVQRIKIDRSFIAEINDRDRDVRVVRAIIGLAKSLDMQVIAEGVETPEQLALLRAERCDQVQGFLLSPGLPAADFAPLLARGFDVR
jgi:diguanylate cyclase (GGDEF)-like protein